MSARKSQHLVVSRVFHQQQSFRTYNTGGKEYLHVTNEQKFYPYRGQVLVVSEGGLQISTKKHLSHYYFSYAITGHCDTSLMGYRIIADRRFRGWGKESYHRLLDAIGNNETLLWHTLEAQQVSPPVASITEIKWQRLLEGWRCVRLQDALINAGFDGKSIIRFFLQYDVLAYDIFHRHPFKVLLYCDPRTLLNAVNKLHQFLLSHKEEIALSLSPESLHRQYEHAILSTAFAQAMATYSTAFPYAQIEQLMLSNSTLNKSTVKRLLTTDQVEHFNSQEGLPLVQLGAVQRTEDLIVALLRQINNKVKPLRKQWKPLTAPLESSPSAINSSHYNLLGEQVKAVLQHGISIIAGGAGSGKSHCVFQLIPEARALGLNVICTALSNVAVHRLREGFSHSKAAINTTASKGQTWQINPVRFMSLAKLAQINYQKEKASLLIFIDEASMLGAGMLWRLLATLRHCAVRLVLLGDPQQLPPIGWGSIFHQLLDSDEAFQIRLKGDWRKQDNSPESPQHPVRKQLIEALDAADVSALANINGVFLPKVTQQEAEDRDAPLEFLFKEYWERKPDLQILCCTSADCETVNAFFERKQLQKLKAKKIHGENSYQIGDPVINVINRPKLGIWNGDIGYITQIPKRKGLFASFSRKEEETDDTIHSVNIPVDRGIRYAYAITVHKAQGMGFRNVGFYLSEDSDHALVHRGMIYTVITRFYEHLLLALPTSVLIEGWKRKNPVDGARSFTALKERQ